MDEVERSWRKRQEARDRAKTINGEFANRVALPGFDESTARLIGTISLFARVVSSTVVV